MTTTSQPSTYKATEPDDYDPDNDERLSGSISHKNVRVQYNTTNSQSSTTLLSSLTFPCTLAQLGWDFSLQNTGASFISMLWFIVYVQEGNSASTINLTSGNTAYQPEQNVLAYGSYGAVSSSSGSATVKEDKGMVYPNLRLNTGDRILLVSLGDSASTVSTVGCVSMKLLIQ